MSSDAAIYEGRAASVKPGAMIAARRHAPKRYFVEPDQRDLGRPVVLEKYFCFTEYPNQCMLQSSLPSEGRCATSSTRDGMRWTRRRRKTGAASRGRRSRVVLIPRRWDQVCDKKRRRRWLAS